MAQWPVYLTIGYSSHEIRRSQVRPERMMIGLIPIYKGDLLSVKLEIYYQTMRVIRKSTYNHKPINKSQIFKMLCNLK